VTQRPGERLQLRRPFKLGRDAPAKMAARRITPDDVLDDATVLVSVYEPDNEHGWTTERIDRILHGDGPEEAPR
jgi:hypothetical protein